MSTTQVPPEIMEEIEKRMEARYPVNKSIDSLAELYNISKEGAEDLLDKHSWIHHGAAIGAQIALEKQWIDVNSIHCECPKCGNKYDITPPTGLSLPAPPQTNK